MNLDSPASIVSHCVIGATAAICVQRENKRPWPFSPSSELYILSATENALASVRVPDLDISSQCWQPAPHRLQVQMELSEYLSFSVGQLSGAQQAGALDPELVVRGLDLHTVIELWFQLAEFPRARFCRQDRPFDELGNIAGLRSMNVSLREDIDVGLPRLLASSAQTTFV